MVYCVQSVYTMSYIVSVYLIVNLSECLLHMSIGNLVTMANLIAFLVFVNQFYLAIMSHFYMWAGVRQVIALYGGSYTSIFINHIISVSVKKYINIYVKFRIFLRVFTYKRHELKLRVRYSQISNIVDI